MRISIVGTGFIGLVSATCFADRGFKVICSTHNKDKANLINKGIPPFYEKDLEPLLKRVVDKGELKVLGGEERKEAILDTDITMICVGTPMREDKGIDLRFIQQSAEEIGETLKDKDSYHLVVVRSTVTPGTTRNLVGKTIAEISGKKVGMEFGLCMQPEFL